MIAGLPIEYAHARASARLAQRPDDRLWTQIGSARSVGAALEAVRSGPAAAYASGVTWPAPLADVELAFRQHWRTRVDEVARWAPDAWRAALRWTAYLIDLPALVHLLGEEPMPPWVGADPVLAPYALEPRGDRRRIGQVGRPAFEQRARRRDERGRAAREGQQPVPGL
ncbi:MAG: hypothetical protein ACK4V1_03810, partial [Burkholderiaceae bacterium]